MRPIATLLACVLFTSAWLAAQRTYVVDQTNGLGTDFTLLTAAVDAAQDGDVLRVRRGAYLLPQQLRKGITILGENEPVLVGVAFSSIAALTYQQTLVVRGCWIVGAFSGLQVLGCQGRVHFDDVVIGSVAFDSLNIVDCRAVTLNRSTVVGQGAAAIAVSGSSNVLLSECVLTGHDMGAQLDRPVTAMTVRGGSLVLVSASTVTGGRSRGSTAPAPGIVLENGRLELAGDAIASVAAGSAPPGTPGAPAIHTTGGSVARDPRVRLLPFGSGPAIDGPAPVSTGPLACLRASATGGGGSIHANLIANPGDLAILLIGPAAQPFPVSPFGNLMINPRRIYFVNVGVVPQSGYVFQNFTIAGSATPGEAIAIQPLTGPGVNLRLHLPVVVTIN